MPVIRLCGAALFSLSDFTAMNIARNATRQFVIRFTLYHLLFVFYSLFNKSTAITLLVVHICNIALIHMTFIHFTNVSGSWFWYKRCFRQKLRSIAVSFHNQKIQKAVREKGCLFVRWSLVLLKLCWLSFKLISAIPCLHNQSNAIVNSIKSKFPNLIHFYISMCYFFLPGCPTFCP